VKGGKTPTQIYPALMLNDHSACKALAGILSGQDVLPLAIK